jgi:hypothetical protein
MKTLWELRHGLLLLVGFSAFCVSALHYPWLWMVPAILILISWPIPRIRRSRSLKSRGFFFIWGSDGSSSYEEMAATGTRVVQLPSRWTEVGRPELFIPTRAEWKLTAPDWAANRRDEIFQRVVSVWDGFEIHYPQDWRTESAGNQCGEQVVAPNRSLPPTLNSTSSVRGSED